jgi:L-fucose isomerase-like protein
VQPTLGLIVVVSSLEESARKAPAILAQASDILSKEGLRLVSPALVDSATAARAAAAHIHEVDAVCVVAATWSEDFMVQDLLAHLEPQVPIVAWALPGLHSGSLCGTQQLCCMLKESGYDYRFVYGELANRAARDRLMAVVWACAAQRALRRSRVGRIGSRMVGMTPVAVDEIELRSVLGPRLIERSKEWLTAQAEAADPVEAEEVWRKACGAVGRVNVPDSEGLIAARYYLALRDFVYSNEINAFTVECFPQLMGRVCLPIALLAAEDVVGACEGDVNSAVAMRILAWFTDGPVHNADLLQDDPVENTVTFSHCGSGAFCLANCREDIVLDSCRLMNVGVTGQYPGRSGRVTLVNLVGRRGTYRLGIASGQAVPTELVFPGNPVKVRLDVPVEQFLEDIADDGLGHHWMIGEGDAVEALLAFARLRHIQICEPGAHPLVRPAAAPAREPRAQTIGLADGTGGQR